MALDYKSSLVRYRRYLQVVQKQPLWQASLFVISSLVLIIILAVSALRPTLVTIAGLVGQIEQDRSLEKRIDEKIVTVQKAQQVYQEVESRLPVLDLAIPTEPDWGSWSESIEQLATNSGVVVRTMLIKGAGAGLLPDQSVQGLSFSISAAGSYQALQNFATQIGQGVRIAKIQSVNISVVNNQEPVVNIDGILGYLPYE